MSNSIADYRTLTDEEIRTKIREFSDILEGSPSFWTWDSAYREYQKLIAVQDERYRVENQAKFDAFYEEHIKGKAWEDIHPDDWQFYSDWHKDMYGYRPRHI